MSSTSHFKLKLWKSDKLHLAIWNRAVEVQLLLAIWNSRWKWVEVEEQLEAREECAMPYPSNLMVDIASYFCTIVFVLGLACNFLVIFN